MTTNQLNKAKEKLRKQERDQMFKRLSDYLMIVAGLSYLADLIEDLDSMVLLPELNEKLRETVDLLIKQDDLFLVGASIKVIDEQNNIKLALRQFQKDLFLNELTTK